jgi:hypothetical protein
LLVVFVFLTLSAGAVAASLSVGKTSQHGVVRVFLASHHRITQLIIQLIVGRDAATGVRFRQRASFSARLTHGTLRGSATVTQTLIATGVVCKSPRVTFSTRL